MTRSRQSPEPPPEGWLTSAISLAIVAAVLTTGLMASAGVLWIVGLGLREVAARMLAGW